MAQSVKPADAGISVGQVFQGKYRVDSIVGHGGMGVVAECTHLALNERVAIKMLRQDVLMDQDAVSRFIREAQAAVKLKSEYVARVSDVGTFENGVPYMVMEFLEGHDLGELLKQRGVLPVQWGVELMLQTAEALAEAHSLGIVHRDVKPTNLFVTWRPDGSALIKVLDFGISKSPMGTDMHLTQTQSLLGTPAYMSPEQMRSARLVDTRTDIWSLGTVFYELLEGRRPFEAESFSEMCVKVAVDPPASMMNTPPGLQQVILRCLAKAPEQRYPNMAEFARDIVPYAADPHGAQMLVDRMARMLRRSSYDWEGGSTGVGRQAVPASARDIGSGPARAQTPLPSQWGLGSDPVGAPWHGKSDPSGRAWHGSTPRGDASQPFARPLSPSEASNPFGRPLPDEASAGTAAADLTLRPKKRLLWLLVGIGLLTTAAIVGGVTYSNRAATSTADQAEMQQPAPPEQTQPAAQPETTMKTNEVDSTPAVGTDVGSATTPPTEGKPEPTESVAATTSDKATPTKSDSKKGASTKGKAARGGTAKGAAKDVKKAPPPPTWPAEVKKEPEKAPDKPCDPFDSMHGCNKGK